MWVGRGRRADGGCPALVRSSHFNMETSASSNSGFNVLEALRFLIQLFYLYIPVFVYYMENVFDVPPVSFRSRCTVSLGQTGGGFGAAGSALGVLAGAPSGPCCPLAFSFPSTFPLLLSLCSKNRLHLRYTPTLWMCSQCCSEEKKEKKKRQKRKRKKKKAVSVAVLFLSAGLGWLFPRPGAVSLLWGGGVLTLELPVLCTGEFWN